MKEEVLNTISGCNTTLIGHDLTTDESNCLIVGNDKNNLTINEQGQFIVNGATIHFDKKIADGIREAVTKVFREHIK